MFGRKQPSTIGSRAKDDNTIAMFKIEAAAIAAYESNIRANTSGRPRAWHELESGQRNHWRKLVWDQMGKDYD